MAQRPASQVDDWVTVQPNDWVTVGASKPKAPPAKGVDDPTREMSAPQLGDTLSAEWLATMLGPFSARGPENAQGKAPFKVPDILMGAYKAATSSLGEQRQAAWALPGALAEPSRKLIAGDPRERAQGAAEFTRDTVPLLFGAGQAANAARRGISKTAETMYQKALQPSPRAFSTSEIDSMVKTGLTEKIPVARAGLNKLDTLVNKINTSIEADIAKKPSATVAPTSVAGRLSAARTKAAHQVLPEADLSTINSAEREFLRQHQTPEVPAVAGTSTTDPYTGVTTKTAGTPAIPAKDIPIPVKGAQALKKGTYQQIGSKPYGELSGASVEAQKQLARGLKEELETVFPEIKAKNAREGKLFDLRPELEAAVNRMGNRGSLMKVLNIMNDPAITSRIAIQLNKLGIPAKTITSRINAFKLMIYGTTQALAKEEAEK